MRAMNRSGHEQQSHPIKSVQTDLSARRGIYNNEDTERYLNTIKRRDDDLRRRGFHEQADAELMRIHERERADAKEIAELNALLDEANNR